MYTIIYTSAFFLVAVILFVEKFFSIYSTVSKNYIVIARANSFELYNKQPTEYIKKFKILKMSSTVNQLQLLTIKIFQQVLNDF